MLADVGSTGSLYNEQSLLKVAEESRTQGLKVVLRLRLAALVRSHRRVNLNLPQLSLTSQPHRAVTFNFAPPRLTVQYCHCIHLPNERGEHYGLHLGHFPMDNDAQVAEEGRRLLLDILPLFASNPDRVDSTKDLYFQAYYYMICTEAKILEDFLKDCNTKASQYADILEKVLKLFENLVKPDILSRTNSFPVCIPTC